MQNLSHVDQDAFDGLKNPRTEARVIFEKSHTLVSKLDVGDFNPSELKGFEPAFRLS
jgi:hypothetical protein